MRRANYNSPKIFVTQYLWCIQPITFFYFLRDGARPISHPGMPGEIRLHPSSITVIPSRVQPVGSSILILLVSVVAEMNSTHHTSRTVAYVRSILLESWTPLKSNDCFLHYHITMIRENVRSIYLYNYNHITISR